MSLDDREEDLKEFLPAVLQQGPLFRALSAPAAVPLADRALFPVRMTLLLVVMIIFAAEAALFAALGHSQTCLVAGAAVGLTASAALLLRKGFAHPALTTVWLVVALFLAHLHLRYGSVAQLGWFVFPVGVSAYLVYRPSEWMYRLLPLLLAVATCALVLVPTEVVAPVRMGEWEQRLLLIAHLAGAVYATLVLASHAAVFREAARLRIATERDRADRLVLNMLPAPIAARLIRGSTTIADDLPDVSVLFADLVGFTKLSGTLDSGRLVELLNEVFSQFDLLAARHGLEKIKTIGDAYMVVGGVPLPLENHAARSVRMAIDMLEAVEEISARHGQPLQLRLGLHLGPVTAGVIGRSKYAYDLWGDTVNIASRMESLGQPGRIHVSRAVADRLRGEFSFVDSRQLEVKGKGVLETWFVGEPIRAV